ncbi:MAG TPA: transglutaminase family protein [Jatrophihabitantaceae bacterium]|nr:transglutaminase family protein [Jatrophihabitantaceae bacterium]
MTDRHVGARLELRVHDPLRLMLQVAVSGMAPAQVDESLQVTCDGAPLEVTEVQIPGQGRVHLADPRPGTVEVTYEATIRGTADTPAVTDADGIVYVRPSRYAESDRLAPIAQAEFAGISGGADLLAAVSSWVGSQLRYVPGSSGPTDGAVDTLLQRQGVCRDYAHLVIALLRALDIPARLAAVYAPGLDPMDFHAVAEAAVDGRWRAVDATLLAPRSSLVRIATGRDAADTSFLSTYGGAADLLRTEVTAVVDGQLPSDDVTALVSLS